MSVQGNRNEQALFLPDHFHKFDLNRLGDASQFQIETLVTNLRHISLKTLPQKNEKEMHKKYIEIKRVKVVKAGSDRRENTLKILQHSVSSWRTVRYIIIEHSIYICRQIYLSSFQHNCPACATPFYQPASEHSIMSRKEMTKKITKISAQNL